MSSSEISIETVSATFGLPDLAFPVVLVALRDREFENDSTLGSLR